MNFNLWSLQGNLPLPTYLHWFSCIYLIVQRKEIVCLWRWPILLYAIYSAEVQCSGELVCTEYRCCSGCANLTPNTILLKIPQIVHSIILHIARLLTLSKKSWLKKLLSGGEEKRLNDGHTIQFTNSNTLIV